MATAQELGLRPGDRFQHTSPGLWQLGVVCDVNKDDHSIEVEIIVWSLNGPYPYEVAPKGKFILPANDNGFSPLPKPERNVTT